MPDGSPNSPGARAELVDCQQCGRRNRLPAAGSGVPRCGNCRSPLPWITAASDADFTQIAESATIDVLVDIWAPWWPLCRRADPALTRLARLLAGQLKLVKVDVTQAPILQRRFFIQAVPTLILMRGPQILAYQAGAPPEPSLRAWLERAAADCGASGRSDYAAAAPDPRHSR